MSQPIIRAVFLDAGQTLFEERRSRPAIYATVARKFGGEGDEALAAESMERAMADLPRSVEGHYRFSLAWFRAFNERVLGELSVAEGRRERAHHELVARFDNPRTFRLFNEVDRFLEQLGNMEVVVGIVSNWSERLPDLCATLGLADKVQFIVASAEIRAEKPDRAIFERALFRAGVAAEETLHVGNHFDRDVRGALGAGLRAVWLDRNASATSSHDGVPVVSDLMAVLPLAGQASHAGRS